MNRLSVIIVFITLIFSSCSLFTKSRSSDDYSNASRKELLQRKLALSEDRQSSLVDLSLFLNTGESQKMDARLYMERDNKIFISLRFLGFEVARAMWEKDSIFYINRLNKEYYFGLKDSFPYYNFSNLKVESFYNYINYELFLSDMNVSVSKLIRMFSKVPYGRFEQEFTLEGGRKILSLYNSQFQLDQFRLTDHENSFYLEGNIRRGNSDLQEINGMIISNKTEIKWKLQINSIKEQNYNRTKFSIGKNYKRIE